MSLPLRRGSRLFGKLETFMADITLAEMNGRVWLVGGEPFLDDLLANTLPAHISIEIVPCESQGEVHALWVRHSGEPATPGMPWVIHPGIVDRIRRAVPENAVFFAQWSALLDEDALAAIRSAARWAGEHSDAPVILTEFLDPNGPTPVAELSRLRALLIEEKLVEFGVERARIGRARRDVGEMPGMPQESQRVDIVVQVD
jgi:hypothetical protein